VRRELWSQLRPLRDTIRLALVLGVVHCLGSACAAEAAAPSFEGTISSPTLCSPRGTALLPGGGLFVGSDCHSLHHMEQFSAAGDLVASWPFPIPPPRRYEGPPNGVAVDASGNLFVTDMGNNNILKCSSSGALLDIWHAAGSMPVDIAVDAFGDVYVAEMLNHRVRKTTSTGVQLAIFGGMGTTPGRFQSVTGVTLDTSGRLYATDNLRWRVVRFLPSGAFDMEFAVATPPTDVAVGPEGNIYVISSDPNDHGVYQYSPGGVFLQRFGSPLGLEIPYRIIIDSSGMIFVTEQYNNRITKFQIDLATPAVPLTFGRLKVMYR
jgi:DNA-binding beta-propeller fold protein YncE